MALPLLQATTYTLTIPSIGKEVKYRPFLVKEQKALLTAQQSEDTRVMVDTLKAVISGCIYDKTIDVSKLSTFDLEFIFMQLRARSVGEIAELLFSCEHCGSKEIRVKFDISDLRVEFPESHTKNIKLNDSIGIMMKYPDFALLEKLENIDANDTNVVFDMILSCVEAIYDTENVYYAQDSTVEELNQFLENLDTAQFNLVKNFFETMPRLTQIVEYNCPKCGEHNVRNLRGISSFF